MTAPNSALAIWHRLSPLPLGKWLFSRVVCFKAPYFGSISPHFEDLRPGRCEVRLRKRRAVTNHIGTVHAIAMCNLAELAAGTMIEATLPATHRWIPKGMTVEYLKKAATNLRGVAALEPLPDFAGPDFARPCELPIPVTVTDTGGALVFRAIITMHVSPRKG
ncbi:MAG: hotdog fold domain-containing protein [Rhodospirillaceae bacterium]|nr:hotdog fold domain-containing protein [Rhodospirillaceae bacterium]